MSGLEAPNGERVSICKSCCKKYFKCTLEQLEKINRRMLQSTKMELTAFIIIKATLWANEVFKDAQKSEQWMTSVNSQFQGSSPLDVILRGEGSHVLKFLAKRLGRKPGASF